MKIQMGQKVSGKYSNGIGTMEFDGVVTSIDENTAGGGFSLAEITLSSESKFDYENTPRQRILVTVVKGEVQDSRYQFN